MRFNKIYVSAPLPFKEAAHLLSKDLQDLSSSVQINSTWHHPDTPTGYSRSSEDIGKDADKDILELLCSDTLIVLDNEGSTGGVAGEIAIALSTHYGREDPIDIWRLGEPRSVWSHHPHIKGFTDIKEMIAAMMVEYSWSIVEFSDEVEG